MNMALVLAFSSASVAVTLALFVGGKRHRSAADWSLAAGLVALALESLMAGLTALAESPAQMLYWQNWRLAALSLLPGVWLLFSLSYARGNYHEFLAKWKFVLLAAFAIPIGLAVLFHGSMLIPAHRGSRGGPWALGLSTPGLTLYLTSLLGAMAVLMNLERTFRATAGRMRWRTKYILLGVAVLFVERAYSAGSVLVFHTIDLSLQTINSGTLLVACFLIGWSLIRTSRIDVKVYPSRSVLLNSITALFSGLYLLMIGVLTKIMGFFSGDNGFVLATLLVTAALAILTVLLVSERLRSTTRRFVSRHFERPQYDYRLVWRAFTEGTARHLEQPDLCRAVVKLVSELFQAFSVTIWLVDDRRESLTFAASTSLDKSDAGQVRLDPAQAAQLMSALREHPDPVDTERCSEKWTRLLQGLLSSNDLEGAGRICSPLRVRGEVLGVMLLGERVDGAPYSLQDFDLLKSMSDQAAASLLNLQLAHRLTQAKQLEAFQTMSTFFVHDLKNTASTLSLMLQNLPLHFNDPVFRQDALSGITKTVTHINELIRRLRLLRETLALQTVEADLNDLVSEALHGLEEAPPAELVRELRPVPKIQVDPEQIRNVVANLVLNARDAIGTKGRIRVETSQRNGWVVLGVSDSGCGMTRDFVQRLLFRPFQTTKKDGIGIGMFQCKMIVEAHRGKIEVDSEVGKGTAFRVLLPVLRGQTA